jgi:hypothetical protein
MNLVYNLFCIYRYLLDLDIPIDFSRTVAFTRSEKYNSLLSTIHLVQSDSSTPRDPARLDAPTQLHLGPHSELYNYSAGLVAPDRGYYKTGQDDPSPKRDAGVPYIL